MKASIVLLGLALGALSLTGGCSDDDSMGSDGEGDGGNGGESGGVDCVLAEAEALPETIEEDLEVGPGCVTVATTRMEDGVTLTIRPGTTVLMQPDAMLSTGDRAGNDSTGSLVAKGTADEPIIFTSSAASPEAGDWQCLLLSASSAASELDHVVVEYGGLPCGNASDEASLVVSGGARISNTIVRHSSSVGAFVDPFNAPPRRFEAITFADNSEASILVGSTKITSLGVGLVFEEDDDVIEVDGSYSGVRSGTWRRQEVPYVLLDDLDIESDQQVDVEPGTEIRMKAGVAIEANLGALRLVGTETDPIRLTSAEPSPAAGDWSCVMAGGSTRFEYVIIEYAGNGSGCTGANYKTAIQTNDAVTVRSVQFKDIDGSAIESGVQCDDSSTRDEWCSNVFESVETPEVTCVLGENLCQ